jgi:uncharacterized protein
VSPWFDDHGRLRAGWRFLLGVIVAIAANMIAMDVAEATVGYRPRLLDAVYRPLTTLLLLAGFSLLLIFADRVRTNPLAAIGLGRRRWLPQFALGIAIGAAMICAAVAVIAIAGQLGFTMTLNGRTAELALLELTILFTGALMEELMFRGYPFQRLVDAVGPAGAVGIVSVLFGLVHLGNPHASMWGLVNTILVGVLLSVAYLRTRSLWLPWGLHFAWNTALGMGFGLPVSGLNQFAVVVKGSAQGPAWLTGGAYGIEASALGTLVILLGFIPLVLTTPHDEHRAPDVAVSAEEAWEQNRSSDQPPLPGIQP